MTTLFTEDMLFNENEDSLWLPEIKAHILANISNCRVVDSLCRDKRLKNLCHTKGDIFRQHAEKHDWLTIPRNLEQFRQYCQYQTDLMSTDNYAEDMTPSYYDKRMKFVKKIENIVKRYVLREHNVRVRDIGEDTTEWDIPEYINDLMVHIEGDLIDLFEGSGVQLTCMLDPMGENESPLIDDDMYEEFVASGLDTKRWRVWIFDENDKTDEGFQYIQYRSPELSTWSFDDTEDETIMIIINNPNETIKRLTKAIVHAIGYALRSYKEEQTQFAQVNAFQTHDYMWKFSEAITSNDFNILGV